MTQNNTTKEIISYSFKKLTCEKAIDKISITNIMVQTEYRRQTFYDHFDDKYDLITWIFSYEVSELNELISIWEKREDILFYLLTYLEENKTYYKKIFLNMKLDSFKDYFIYYIKKEVQTIMKDYYKKHIHSEYNQSAMEITTEFYAYGLAELLYRWVLKDCVPQTNNFHKLLTQAIPTQF